MTESIDVVVIGGGYAGVMAANRLTRRADVTVTLVNPRPMFVDRIRLHQLVAGTHDAVADYRTVLNGRVQLVVDAATRIDAADRSVTLAGGGSLHYDHLIYAVGSTGAAPNVPGAAEFAHPVASLDVARGLRAVLADAPATAPVVVVGAGPTGMETAAELATTARKVTLVSAGPLGPYLHPRVRPAVATRIERLGVTVLEGARVCRVTADAVTLADGRTLPSAVTVWTAGFTVPDLAARSGLTTDAAGRLLTDETLTSVDDQRIVAAGDAAAPSGAPFRMSCQAAMQVGPQAAETVLARIAGRSPAPVVAGFAGQCISLGRQEGFFQFARWNDEPVPVSLGGRPGAALKELICSSIRWQLAFEARHPGLLHWWMPDIARRRLPEGVVEPAPVA